MSLSRREETLARHPARQDVRFAPDRLADELRKDCTELAFAYLMGSARDGCVRRGADLDLAVYFTDGTDIDWVRVNRVMAVAEAACPGTECDLGILNRAGPVFRFEALRGVRLFVRESAWETYAAFYSLTCREYEEWGVRQAGWRACRRLATA